MIQLDASNSGSSVSNALIPPQHLLPYRDIRVVMGIAVLAAALSLFVAVTGTSIRGVAAVALTLGVSWFCGTSLLRMVLPANESLISRHVLGAVFGLTLFRLTIVATAGVVGNRWSVEITLSSMILLGYIVRRIARLELRHWDDDECQEAWRLLSMLSVVVVAITIPYWGIARPTPSGYAFVRYFNHDFLHHVAISAELSRAIPPQNPFFAGEVLHYYWLYHVWPGAIVSATSLPAIEVLKLTNIATALIFVGSLFVLMRQYFSAWRARLLAISLALFSYSYIGWLVLFKAAFAGEMRRWIPVTLAQEPSLLSHGWFRDFLYEPHAIASLSLVVLAIYVSRVPHVRLLARCCLIGFALAGSLATDGFVGGIATVSFTTVGAFSVWNDRRFSWRPTVILGSTWLGLVGAFVSLGMFPLGERFVTLGPHPVLRVAPAYLAVDLGPLLLAGAAGLVLTRRHLLDQHFLRGHAVLLAVALGIGFSLVVATDPAVILRKSLKVIQLPLLVFAAPAIAFLWDSARKPLRVLGGTALAFGVITFTTDLYQHVDFYQPRSVTYVSPAEWRALEWVRTHTDSSAVFQSADEVRPSREYLDTFFSLIAALGERRTLFGNYHTPWSLRVPQAKIDIRLAQLLTFTANDPDAVWWNLKQLKLDYLWVDARAPITRGTLKALQDRRWLRVVHTDGPISVMKVERTSPERTGETANAVGDTTPADHTT